MVTFHETQRGPRSPRLVTKPIWTVGTPPPSSEGGGNLESDGGGAARGGRVSPYPTVGGPSLPSDRKTKSGCEKTKRVGHVTLPPRPPRASRTIKTLGRPGLRRACVVSGWQRPPPPTPPRIMSIDDGRGEERVDPSDLIESLYSPPLPSVESSFPHPTPPSCPNLTWGGWRARIPRRGALFGFGWPATPPPTPPRGRLDSCHLPTPPWFLPNDAFDGGRRACVYLKSRVRRWCRIRKTRVASVCNNGLGRIERGRFHGVGVGA